MFPEAGYFVRKNASASDLYIALIAAKNIPGRTIWALNTTLKGAPRTYAL